MDGSSLGFILIPIVIPLVLFISHAAIATATTAAAAMTATMGSVPDIE